MPALYVGQPYQTSSISTDHDLWKTISNQIVVLNKEFISTFLINQSSALSVFHLVPLDLDSSCSFLDVFLNKMGLY